MRFDWLNYPKAPFGSTSVLPFPPSCFCWLCFLSVARGILQVALIILDVLLHHSYFGLTMASVTPNYGTVPLLRRVVVGSPSSFCMPSADIQEEPSHLDLRCSWKQADLPANSILRLSVVRVAPASVVVWMGSLHLRDTFFFSFHGEAWAYKEKTPGRGSDGPRPRSFSSRRICAIHIAPVRAGLGAEDVLGLERGFECTAIRLPRGWGLELRGTFCERDNFPA